jgi:hypothetical protein
MVELVYENDTSLIPIELKLLKWFYWTIYAIFILFSDWEIWWFLINKLISSRLVIRIDILHFTVVNYMTSCYVKKLFVFLKYSFSIRIICKTVHPNLIS